MESLENKWCLSGDLNLPVSEVDKQGGGSLQASGLTCAKAPSEGEVGQSRESFCMVGGVCSSGRKNSSRVAEGPPLKGACEFSHESGALCWK